MFFVAFDQVQRNQQSQFKTFLSKLTFAFKMYFYISVGYLLYNVISMNGFLFANIPSRTFSNNLELWRLFTSRYATLDGLYGLISLIVSFWWLISLFPGYERKYSSIYLLVEVFIQNLLIQVTYSIIVSIIVNNTYFYQTYNDYFFSIGWIPIIIVWIFKFTGQCMEQKSNFCFLPFMLKNKHLAWLISLIMILLTIQKTPLIVATLLGFIQFHVFKRSCLRLPLCFYVILQKPFLLCRCFPSFVKTQDVIHNLSLICTTSIAFNEQELTQQNIGYQNTLDLGNKGKTQSGIEMQMANQYQIQQEKQEKQEKFDLNQ